MNKLVGSQSLNVLGRGTEFQTFTAIFGPITSMIAFGLRTTAAFTDDEEERIYEQTMRYWFPLWLNTVLDFTTDDPWRGFRVYSKGFESVIEAMQLLLPSNASSNRRSIN